jgi:aryl-alcohol dehydrogenase-like predicted oxidoreductase
VRYVAASNFSGWQLMKSLAVSERHGYARYVAHQSYYSLLGREYEWELMPLALDQRVSTLVWSPLGWGRLTGKIRRGSPLPERSRLYETSAEGPPVSDERVFEVVDALEAVGAEVGASVPQVAIAWFLSRPSVSSVILGARDEGQLRENLRAAEVRLSPSHIARLDDASRVQPVSPYWHQLRFSERNPFPTDLGQAKGVSL